MKKILFFLTAVIFVFCFGGISAAEKKMITGPDGVSFGVKTVKIKKSDTYFKLFGKNWRFAMILNKIDEKYLRVGQTIIAPATPEDWKKLKKWSPLPRFDETLGKFKKAVLVDLKSQYFGAYEYGKLKFFGPVSSGSEKCLKTVEKNGEKIDFESNCETPAGSFRSLARHKDHFSSEYEDAEGNGVLMPYAVMFTIQKDKDKGKKTAFWIHGGVLPGYPASHGCVRVFVEDAEKIFYFVNPKKEEGGLPSREASEGHGEIEWFPPKKSIAIIVVN